MVMVSKSQRFVTKRPPSENRKRITHVRTTKIWLYNVWLTRGQRVKVGTNQYSGVVFGNEVHYYGIRYPDQTEGKTGHGHTLGVHCAVQSWLARETGELIISAKTEIFRTLSLKSCFSRFQDDIQQT
jgi:hypothetical protein